MSQLDWFRDEEKKFEDLPEGFYTAALTNATLDETKEEPRFSLEFTLSTRRKVWMNLRMNEKQKKFFNWQMRELGIYERAKELVEAGKPITHAFIDALAEIIGSQWELEITYRDWQGKRYQSVKIDGRAATVAPAAPVNPRVAQTVRSAVKQAQAPQGAAQVAPPPTFNADEELPF